MKRLDWKRYTPPEWGISAWIVMSRIALVVAVCATFAFFTDYINAWNRLYTLVDLRAPHPPRELIPGAVIAPFEALIYGKFYWFPIYWFCLLMEVFDCYGSFRRGSRSIYLMRRLPDKWELHRRCWGRPLIFFVQSLALMACLTAFYFLIYLVFTPKGCLPF